MGANDLTPDSGGLGHTLPAELEGQKAQRLHKLIDGTWRRTVQRGVNKLQIASSEVSPRSTAADAKSTPCWARTSAVPNGLAARVMSSTTRDPMLLVSL